MTRKKFEVSLTIELDDRGGQSFAVYEEDVVAVSPTNAMIKGLVDELSWVGGCRHPADALHSNRKIKVANIKVRRAK